MNTKTKTPAEVPAEVPAEEPIATYDGLAPLQPLNERPISERVTPVEQQEKFG